MKKENTRSILLLLNQFGFSDRTLERIYENEDSILTIIYDQKHPFHNKYFDIYTSKEKELSKNFDQLLEFSKHFTEKMKEYKSRDIKIYYKFSDEYPAYLFKKGDEPLFLYCYGNLNLLDEKILKVSIIGTRKPTKYGIMKTKEYVKKYVMKNWITVSGLARGIDTVVHKETLENQGKTIAVIPTSFEKIYPVENKGLFEEIINNNGLVISLVGPFENTYKSNFLERNSVIAKISNEIFVIEAGVKSGTLNTVRKGYQFNKAIYYDPTVLDKEVIEYISKFNAIDATNRG
ncbi:DNA-processing protein DprA [Priestia sp. YIM B13551]|uniref:DNA-processing protein DprA n=1 Tax=Priestia sp. YIM B13551 TaxID=3366306 RepID=UPI003670C26A